MRKSCIKKVMSILKIKFLTSLSVVKNDAAKFPSNNTRKKDANYRSMPLLIKRCSEKQVHTNAGLKLCQYLRLHMKIICQRFHIKTSFTF